MDIVKPQSPTRTFIRDTRRGSAAYPHRLPSSPEKGNRSLRPGQKFGVLEIQWTIGWRGTSLRSRYGGARRLTSAYGWRADQLKGTSDSVQARKSLQKSPVETFS